MFAKPQAQHRWLDQLIGIWDFEHSCEMPDGTKQFTPGRMECRSLGGMWLICESKGKLDEGGSWTSIMTLGFDVIQNEYVGTFIGSMMSNIWPYRGQLDESGKRLPLYSSGPKFDGTGIGQFRDTVEIVDADTWLFMSEKQNDEQRWIKFMEGKHKRSN